MKKTFFALLVILFSTVSFAQDKDCKKYKNGTFRLTDKVNGHSYIIKRNGNIQTEERDGETTKLEFDVKWLSDCVYTLHPNKEAIEFLKVDYTVIVEIIEIKEHSLVLKMFAKESPNNILTSEVEIVN